MLRLVPLLLIVVVVVREDHVLALVVVVVGVRVREDHVLGVEVFGDVDAVAAELDALALVELPDARAYLLGLR